MALSDGLGGVNRSGDGMSVLEQTPHMALRDGLGGVKSFWRWDVSVRTDTTHGSQ